MTELRNLNLKLLQTTHGRSFAIPMILYKIKMEMTISIDLAMNGIPYLLEFFC